MSRTRAIAFFLNAAVNGKADRRQRREGEPPRAPHNAPGSDDKRTDAQNEHG